MVTLSINPTRTRFPAIVHTKLLRSSSFLSAHTPPIMNSMNSTSSTSDYIRDANSFSCSKSSSSSAKRRTTKSRRREKSWTRRRRRLRKSIETVWYVLLPSYPIASSRSLSSSLEIGRRFRSPRLLCSSSPSRRRSHFLHRSPRTSCRLSTSLPSHSYGALLPSNRIGFEMWRVERGECCWTAWLYSMWRVGRTLSCLFIVRFD